VEFTALPATYKRRTRSPRPRFNAADLVRYDHGRAEIREIGNENLGKVAAGYKIDTTQ
jgi:hypothetical protein